MSTTLPKILSSNMDKWEYDDDGKMIPVKGASLEVVEAINEMNELQQNDNSEWIIDY